mmetsp:Transcript_845/g.2468  ORF Transcript_845/g.2468 Transcript_845/m.2468 type:complete len:321 (+) Transcript_845:52-1014(+)
MLLSKADKDRQSWLKRIKEDSRAFAYAPEDLRADPAVALTAVRQNGDSLEHALGTIKSDKDVVLAAVTENSQALQYSSLEMRNDRDIVLAAVAGDGMVLKEASSDLRKDRAVVLAAVQQNGFALQYAEDGALLQDREIILTAAANNGHILQLICMKEMGSDRELVLAAVASKGFAIQHASRQLREDREVVLAAMTENPLAGWRHGSPQIIAELMNDPEVVQKHFSKHYIFIIASLSGRSCVYVGGSEVNKRRLLRHGVDKLGLPQADVTHELLLNGELVPEKSNCNKWPGVKLGEATELQIVISQRTRNINADRDLSDSD